MLFYNETFSAGNFFYVGILDSFLLKKTDVSLLVLFHAKAKPIKKKRILSFIVTQNGRYTVLYSIAGVRIAKKNLEQSVIKFTLAILVG